MRNLLIIFIPILSLIVFGCTQSSSRQVGEMQFADGNVQHVVHAKDIEWKPCPPSLPEGCEMAVLEGSPKSSDLFSVRFKINGAFFMPAHTHPKDERATILQGRAYVAFGKDGTRDDAKEFGPGDYYVNARNAIHTVWADSGTIIQLTGIGPWKADFIKE